MLRPRRKGEPLTASSCRFRPLPLKGKTLAYLLQIVPESQHDRFLKTLEFPHFEDSRGDQQRIQFMRPRVLAHTSVKPCEPD